MAARPLSRQTTSRYRTIVADPPWQVADSGRRTDTGRTEAYEAKGSGREINPAWWNRFTGTRTELPYKRMSVEEIAALPVGEMAEPDAHLYLWTTNGFLRDAYTVAEAWGFKFSTLITWCKTPMGLGYGGAYALTTEYLMFCRKGSLAPQRRWDTTWIEASRVYENGHIAHSAKPDCFLDIVEQVSPGPYLELFARRARFGWSYWGNESLGTAELPELA